jgi:hypothetical protein
MILQETTMPNATIDKIRKALNDTKKPEKITDSLDKANSLFEDSLKDQFVRCEKINFHDVVLYEHKSFTSSACYICNEKVLVLLNVVASPNFVTHWKIKDGDLGQNIQQAIIFFQSGSRAVSELVLSKYEIDKRRGLLKQELKDKN